MFQEQVCILFTFPRYHSGGKLGTVKNEDVAFGIGVLHYNPIQYSEKWQQMQ
jgi:hypothetical protein